MFFSHRIGAQIDPDHIVGKVFGGCYSPVHNTEIDFDAGLIELDATKAGPNSFSRDGHIIRRIKECPPEGTAAFYGASSGFKTVTIRRLDVATELKAFDLNGNAIRLSMSRLIEVVDSDDRKRAVASVGDSGAPLVVGSDGNYSLVGYLVAAGIRMGGKRHPRTLAAPVDVLFDALSIELV